MARQTARQGMTVIGVLVLLAGCGSSSKPGAGAFADRSLAQCAMTSPLREIGAGRDAPGTLEIPVSAGGHAEGPCSGNRSFRFGSGLHDITGPVANTGGAGWESPTQVFGGLHQRQYARAFAIASPCSGRRIMFVSADIGLMFGSVRSGVLDAIAADPVLAQTYGGENLMLSATHTHSGPAGYSHHEAPNALHFGYDELVYRTIVDGIVAAIRLAHANLEAHADTAGIRMTIGELLDTNINRSKPAFLMNDEAERRRFLDARGSPVEVNKRVVQLDFVRGNDSAVGIINWFGVHPTVIGPTQKLVSSDNKGYASLGFERIMRTNYTAASGSDSFVAAFAQADEGDSSPNIFIEERPHPDPTRGGGADDFESNAISGTRQLAKALELYGRGSGLSGPIDYRFFHVAMNDVEVSDPLVLASLRHPAALDANPKRTCGAALGVSFPAGAEDGPSPFSTEGIVCGADPNALARIASDFAALSSAHLPNSTVSSVLLCNADTLPLLNLGCHAEKPVLLPLNLGEAALGEVRALLPPETALNPLNLEPHVLPFQIFRIGNLALLGLPWEVTTVAARRLREDLLEVLAPVGIDTVVIAGLVNDYIHYLTTREEYASQQYEGASNVFGPWTLAAAQQEVRRLAIALRDGTAPAPGPAYPRATPFQRRPPYVPSDLPGPRAFGALVEDVAPSAAPGDIVRAEFQAGHPRNDLKLQSAYVFAERRNADGSWTVVAQDRDPELVYLWTPMFPSPLPLDPPLIGPSTASAVWTLPRNTPAGVYRLRHEGVAQTAALPPSAYSGVSSPFTVSAPVERCP